MRIQDIEEAARLKAELMVLEQNAKTLRWHTRRDLIVMNCHFEYDVENSSHRDPTGAVEKTINFNLNHMVALDILKMRIIVVRGRLIALGVDIPGETPS